MSKKVNNFICNNSNISSAYVGIYYFFIDNSNNRCISVARASKMLALLESDKTTINSYSDGNDDRWYYKYMNYCQKNGLTEKDKIKKIYNRAYTYGDLRFYLNSKR